MNYDGNWSFFQILIWPGGGPIGGLLWLLSIVMVALIIQFFVSIRRSRLLPDLSRDRLRQLVYTRDYNAAIEQASTDRSFLAGVIHAALAESAHGYFAMERAIEQAAEDQTNKLLRQVEWLNLLGNIGPMLGLMGTVWGMIRAFFTIVSAGGIPDPSQLAGAIGIALVTTLLGLMVAIPSLAVYAVMRNRIDAISREAVIAGMETISSFRPTVRKS